MAGARTCNARGPGVAAMARAGCTLTLDSVRVGPPIAARTTTSSPRQGDRLVLLPPAAWSATLPDSAPASATGAPLNSAFRVRGTGRRRRGAWGTACAACAALVVLLVGAPVAVAVWDASRAPERAAPPPPSAPP